MSSLLQNSFFNIIYRGLNIIFPLITAAYVSRVLSAEGIGKVSFAQNIVSYFILIAGLGLANYGTKEIGKYQSNQKKYSQTFWELFIINSISTFICTLAYVIFILSSGYFVNDKNLYMVVGISLFFNYLQIDWFYQGIEEYKYIAVRSVIIKFVFLFALFIFVKKESDIIPYALITVLGTGLNYVFNVARLKKYVIFSNEIFRKLEILKHIKPAIVLLATTISVQLYTKVDTTMLGIIKGDRSVGLYTYAVKIADLILNLVIAVSMILLPRLSLYYHSNKQTEFKNLISFSEKIIIFISMPIIVGICIVADDAVILLFGKEFIMTVPTVKILSLLIIIKSIGYLYGTQVLMTVNQENKLLYSTICGAIINICLNSILIPRMSQNGAAIASVASELIVMIVQMQYARKFVYPYTKNAFFYLKTLMATFLMGIVVKQVYKFLPGGNIRLFMCIMVGALFYLGICVFCRNEVILWGIKKVKRLKL